MRTARLAAACAAVLAVGAVPAAADPPADRRDGKERSAFKSQPKSAPTMLRRTDTRSKPVLFLHGLDAFGTAGNDCNATFGKMISTLRAWGYSGTLATVKYYHGDTNCTTSLDAAGSHSSFYARTDAHQNGSHDMDGDIRHLAYHLAWTIYNQYSSKGVTVDLVGHSMGGLIIRSMLRYNQENNASFPPYLYVEDVTTLGTPHSGSGYASWCGWAYQCNQMATGSSFLSDLATNAKNPQGDGGTDWTNVGSYDDGTVSQTSATSMDASHKVRYLGSMNIGHSDYMNDVSDVRDADVEYYDRGTPWYSWYDAPHAVRWSDFALLYGSW